MCQGGNGGRQTCKDQPGPDCDGLCFLLKEYGLSLQAMGSMEVLKQKSSLIRSAF